MNRSKTEQLLDILQDTGMIRAKDLRERGIHPEYLRRLFHQGIVVRSGRGLYTSASADLTDKQSLVEACARVQNGVICLLSALRFHELTTQAPFEVWLAIHNKARSPSENIIPLRIVYMSGKALEAGIENHLIMGHSVHVYNIPKTVADCFKFRHKIGLDVALEALRQCWHQKRTSIDEIWHYAKICRVANVIRPYLESLT